MRKLKSRKDKLASCYSHEVSAQENMGNSFIEGSQHSKNLLPVLEHWVDTPPVPKTMCHPSWTREKTATLWPLNAFLHSVRTEAICMLLWSHMWLETRTAGKCYYWRCGLGCGPFTCTYLVDKGLQQLACLSQLLSMVLAPVVVRVSWVQRSLSCWLREKEDLLFSSPIWTWTRISSFLRWDRINC
jgi:hypothetical protein